MPRQPSHGFGQPALPLRLCTGLTLLPHEIHVETCPRSSHVPPNQAAKERREEGEEGRGKKKRPLENPGFDPGTSRMQSGRSAD